MPSFDADYLSMARREARRLRDLGERAFAQVDEARWLERDDDDDNSLAIVVKHVAGNLHSRWRDFLSTDGEKADRNRDGEFEIDERDDVPALKAAWARGFDTMIGSLEALEPGDLARTVTIRGEPHRVTEAISRSLLHTSYHLGQVVQLSRRLRRGEWQSLSIPRGGSQAHTESKKRYLEDGSSEAR